MSNDLMTETRETGTHGRSPLTWLVAAAAVVIIAAVGAFGVLRHDAGSDQPPSAARDQTPTVTELTGPSGGVDAKCMVPSAAVLGQATLAFEGTVQKITDGVVTLVPSHVYAGPATDVVTITAAPEAMQQLVGAVKFEDNGRYLISSTNGQVSVCGFSGPYTADLAALYDEAFAS